MRKLKLKTDGTAVAAVRQTVLVFSLLLTFLPVLIFFWSDLTAAPEIYRILHHMFFTGASLLTAFTAATFLLSQYSPVKRLAVRKKLIRFTRFLMKSETDGILFHSVEWRYAVKDKKIIIDLYPNGLIKDTADTGKKLSQFLRENLLSYRESDIKARYIFGSFPKRYDGAALLAEGISGVQCRQLKPTLPHILLYHRFTRI